MIVERSMSSNWLSNTYLVADRPGGHAVVIDTGGPVAPILARIEALRVTPTHVLCTHHHHDHVAHNATYAARFGCPVCGGAAERELFGGTLDVALQGDEEIESGDLRIRALHIPGHTSGQLGFVVGDASVFTGDTLFRGSIGGTRGPGHTTCADIRHSIMEVLMRLPAETVVYPGHMEATTVGREWQENPFVRAWRRATPPAGRRGTAFGDEAEILVSARDYDGGTKHWVRFDDGREDVVPGSRVRVAE